MNKIPVNSSEQNISKVDKDLKYLQVSKQNDIHSGANPFLLHTFTGVYRIHENNTGVGLKYLTNPEQDNLSASKFEKKHFEFSLKHKDNIKERNDARTYFNQEIYSPTKPILFQGEQGKYYMVDGEKYDEHFPYEWATNHLSHPVFHEGSGPLNCENCKKYGTILTVFVGYCIDCHTNIYKRERPGIHDAVDTSIDQFRILLPYMEDVRFINIGDRRGWTLLKEREQRRLEKEEQELQLTDFHKLQIHKRNDLLIRSIRKEHIEENEWDDYWGGTPVTNKDLFRWATSEYL